MRYSFERVGLCEQIKPSWLVATTIQMAPTRKTKTLIWSAHLRPTRSVTGQAH
jgi:hypothetical protein